MGATGEADAAASRARVELGRRRAQFERFREAQKRDLVDEVRAVADSVAGPSAETMRRIADKIERGGRTSADDLADATEVVRSLQNDGGA